MTEQDQPRLTDLDAAIDAVVPSLTAVDDDAAASSLRRTRIALAEGRRAAAVPGAWRWGLTAAAAAIVLAAAAIVWQWRTPSAPPIATAPRTPAPAVAPVTPIAPAPPERVASAAPQPRVVPRRSTPVRATSVAAEASRRPDPLIALVTAVQAIPEDAWTRGTTPSDVHVDPIAIAPLETAALGDSSEPVAPGEP